jgi:hypothetical protein
MSSWDPEELKRLVEAHSVAGYHVAVPLFGHGVIEKQIRPEKGGFIFYKVVANKPVPFKVFAKDMGVSAKPMSISQWRERFVKGAGAFPAMAWDLRERLEQGGTVSQADVLFRELMDRGCVDIDQNVFCYTFPSKDVSIEDPEPGQLVEVSEGHGAAGWPGRFLGIHEHRQGIALVEQFSPVPYMRTPEALIPAAVKKEYALPITWVLAYGVANALQDAGWGLPPGAWSENSEEYVLEKPIPLSRIETFCDDPATWKKLRQVKSISCLQHAMMLHTLPLLADEISFGPLPEGVTDDILASLDFRQEMEAAEGISWPNEESFTRPGEEVG